MPLDLWSWTDLESYLREKECIDKKSQLDLKLIPTRHNDEAFWDIFSWLVLGILNWDKYDEPRLYNWSALIGEGRLPYELSDCFGENGLITDTTRSILYTDWSIAWSSVRAIRKSYDQYVVDTLSILPPSTIIEEREWTNNIVLLPNTDITLKK